MKPEPTLVSCPCYGLDLGPSWAHRPHREVCFRKGFLCVLGWGVEKVLGILGYLKSSVALLQGPPEGRRPFRPSFQSQAPPRHGLSLGPDSAAVRGRSCTLQAAHQKVPAGDSRSLIPSPFLSLTARLGAGGSGDEVRVVGGFLAQRSLGKSPASKVRRYLTCSSPIFPGRFGLCRSV